MPDPWLGSGGRGRNGLWRRVRHTAECSSSAAASPAGTSRGCSAAAARRSSARRTSCSTRRCSPGRVGHARAAAHGRAATADVPPRRAAARPRDPDRRGAAERRCGTGRQFVGALRPARARRRRRPAHPRCRASPSTPLGSRTWPTPSSCAIESCASSRPTPRRRAASTRPPRLRLRRRRLRGCRGARRARRPGQGRAPLVSGLGPRPSAGCSSTPPRRSSPRSRRASATTPKELAGRGVEIRVGTTLESYDGSEAVLQQGPDPDAHTRLDGRREGEPARRDLRDAARRERGRVRVDEHLRVEGRERVWALGDCAAVPNRATPGRFDPPTCQHALRQARRLAKNLQGDVAPYRYTMLGQVATLGRYKGIADVMGVRLRGFPAGG